MSEAAATPQGPLQRLHPLTLGLLLPRMLASFLWPVVLVYFASSKERALVRSAGYLLFAFAIATVSACVRFFTFRYGIAGDELVIESGWLHRLSRRVPLARIQNVTLVASPMQRLFGVVAVRVETAGGEGVEATLSLVGREVGERLRERLLARRAAEGADAAGGAGETVLRRATFAEILLLGATENRAGAIAVALLGAWSLADDFGLPIESWLESTIERRGAGIPFAEFVVPLALVVLFAGGGWIASMLIAVTMWSGFTLSKSGDGLRRRHGLLTRFEAIVALDRVQAIVVEANPLRRRLGRALVRVRTAGGRGPRGSGSTVLYPLLRDAEIAPFGSMLFGAAGLDPHALERVHPLAVRRGFVKYLLLLAPAPIALGAARDPRWLLLLAAVLPLAAWLARLRYAALGFAHREGFVLSRSGVWTRETTIVPCSRIQSLALRASPTQRRLGLASVIVDVAGGGHFSAPTIVDLEREQARRLFLALADEAVRSRDSREV